MSFTFAMKYFKIVNPLDLFAKTHRIKIDNHRLLEFKYNQETKLLRWSVLADTKIAKLSTKDYILLVDDIRMLAKTEIKISSIHDDKFIFLSKNGSLQPLETKQSTQGDLLDNLLVAYDYSKIKSIKNLFWITQGRSLKGEIDPLKFFQVASVAAQSSIKIHTIAMGPVANTEMLKKVSQISDAHFLRDITKIDQVFHSKNEYEIMLCTKDQIDCITLQAGLHNVVSLEEKNVQYKKVFSELKINTSNGVKTYVLSK